MYNKPCSVFVENAGSVRTAPGDGACRHRLLELFCQSMACQERDAFSMICVVAADPISDVNVEILYTVGNTGKCHVTMLL